MIQPHSPIIVALDFPDKSKALALANQLDPTQCAVKVGLELFLACGREIVRELHARGFRVFLDLKFHDIPNTVAGAVRAAADLNVWMLNVHCSSAGKGLAATVNALADTYNRPLLIGVTVLTSHDENELKELGFARRNTDPAHLAARWARMAINAGLDGVVCSGEEAKHIRQQIGNDAIIVTPGIRLPNGEDNDQKRVVTPQMALQNGANYLVIGRPITQATDPAKALETFSNLTAKTHITGARHERLKA